MDDREKERLELAARFRPALRKAVQEAALRPVADLIGISHTTLRNLIENEDDVPSPRTVAKVEQWLVDAESQGAADHPPTPAELLIKLYGHKDGLRKIGRVSTQDVISAAYSVAMAERFPPEEMLKLDLWRNRVLSQEQRDE
jgi:hypothetical protein